MHIGLHVRLAATTETFENVPQTVDWFHVVQLFTAAVDDVRKAEAKQMKLPDATRWAVFDGGKPADRQAAALTEPEVRDFLTAQAWRIKEMLRWVRSAETRQAARWRLSHFLRHARDKIVDNPVFEKLEKAIETVEKHQDHILERWTSTHNNARWKPSTASSKPPSQEPGAIATWQLS